MQKRLLGLSQESMRELVAKIVTVESHSFRGISWTCQHQTQCLEGDQDKIWVITQNAIYMTKFPESMHFDCPPFYLRQPSLPTLTIYVKCRNHKAYISLT